jgi:hypothetical protein
MKKNPFRHLTFLIIPVMAAICQAGVGQSAAITLVFPYGARSCSMGEVGTALADDESVLFFNPAGLAVPNEKWEGGSGSGFWEPLLPVFKLKELWHATVSAQIQDTVNFWCHPGFFLNYINMGVNNWVDELGRNLGSARSYEGVLAAGCGLDFKDLGIENHYLGVTAKYVHSALAPGIGGIGNGIGRTVAVDVGYLWTIGNGFRFGATAMNMGPAIYYINPDNSDPIPFTINLALAYKSEVIIDDLRFLGIAGEFRLDREVVKNYIDRRPDPFYKALWTDLLHDKDETAKFELQQINEHLGGEITILNTVSLRSGFLIDLVGERYEQTFGLGLNFLNHISLNFGFIHSPEGHMKEFSRLFDPHKTGSSGARDGQYRISFTWNRFTCQTPDDFEWWKVRNASSTPPPVQNDGFRL